MNELISVIIPVYNSEAYIRECIQSVIDQTYSNLEILVIDDGSVDHSREICNDISKIDERIRVFPKEHQGVSAARNIGLRSAKGKYLFFLDADDVIHYKLLETLHGLIEKTHSKIAMSQYYFGKEGDFKKQIIPEINSNSIEMYTYLDNQKALDCFIHGVYKEFPALCGKLISSNAVQNIVFDESLQNGEDTKFIYQILWRRADVVLFYQKGYYYRQHENSVSKVCTIEAYQSMYICERYICDHEKEAGRVENAVIREVVIISRIIGWYVKNRYFNNQMLLKYLDKLANDERKKDIYSYVSLRNKIELFLVSHCYPLYCVLVKILKCI